MQGFKDLLTSCWGYLNHCTIDFGSYSFTLFQLLGLCAILSIAGYIIWGLMSK